MSEYENGRKGEECAVDYCSIFNIVNTLPISCHIGKFGFYFLHCDIFSCIADILNILQTFAGKNVPFIKSRGAGEAFKLDFKRGGGGAPHNVF